MIILLTMTFVHERDAGRDNTSTVRVALDVTLKDERDFVLRTTVTMMENRKHPLREIRKMLARSFDKPLRDLESDLNYRTYTYHPKRHPKDVLEVVRPLAVVRYWVGSSFGPPDTDAVVRSEMVAFAATPMMLMTALSLRRPGRPPEDLVSAYMERVTPHERTLCWIYIASQAWRMRLSLLDLVKTDHLSRDSIQDAVNHIVASPRLRLDWEHT